MHPQQVVMDPALSAGLPVGHGYGSADPDHLAGPIRADLGNGLESGFTCG